MSAVIIAGSRSITDPEIVRRAVATSGFLADLDEVVSGMAAGVDTLGENWAKANGVRVVGFPANWNKYGRQAGMIRNMQMARYADALIAIWDGKSRGTANMISKMLEYGKPVHVVRTDL